LPQDDNQRISLDDRLVIVLKNARARLQSETRPLRLHEEQLEQIVLEAQKSTIAPDSGVEPFTLEEIREMLSFVEGEPQEQRPH
jgi:hypothetical protein